MQIDDVKSALSGPVASVYATFHEDGTLAPPSLRQPVRRRYGAGEGFFYGHRRQVIIVQRLKIESIAAYFVIRILGDLRRRLLAQQSICGWPMVRLLSDENFNGDIVDREEIDRIFKEAE